MKIFTTTVNLDVDLKMMNTLVRSYDMGSSVLDLTSSEFDAIRSECTYHIDKEEE